jgi:hypothetical protein
MARDPKPLSKAARAAAVDVARSHERLQSLLAGRGRVIAVEPNLHDQRSPDDADTVVVGIYDYEADSSLVALVDPKAGRVLGIEDTGAQFQLSDEEEREAEELAHDDPRVREFLGSRAMHPLTRLYFPPGGSSHRHAIVFLRPTNFERRYAVVDLSTGTVVDVLDRLTG